jgi:hypothetical protein
MNQHAGQRNVLRGIAAALGFVPAAGVLFCLARAAFLSGYLSGRPTNRAAGFACTFYPSVLLLSASVVMAIMGAP